MRRGSLTCVGTGMLLAGQVTQEALSTMESAEKLFFLVHDSVTQEWLRGLNPSAESLYDSYGEGRDRSSTYAEMVQRILAPVRAGQDVCAAFYGHPGVFVQPSHDAIAVARAEGHEARMLPGISSEDCLFADLGLDPGTRGCQSFEATDFLLRRRRFDPQSLLILWQVGAIGVRDFRKSELWNRDGVEVLASELLGTYPKEHEVIVYEATPYPVCAPVIHPVALGDLGRAPITLRTTLCVPPLPERKSDQEMARRLGLRCSPIGPLDTEGHRER